MNAITIRKLPDGAKQRLRMRAAAQGRSMEAEARSILLEALARPAVVDLAWIEELIAVADEVGGVELESLPDEDAAVADFS